MENHPAGSFRTAMPSVSRNRDLAARASRKDIRQFQPSRSRIAGDGGDPLPSPACGTGDCLHLLLVGGESRRWFCCAPSMASAFCYAPSLASARASCRAAVLADPGGQGADRARSSDLGEETPESDRRDSGLELELRDPLRKRSLHRDRVLDQPLDGRGPRLSLCDVAACLSLILFCFLSGWGFHSRSAPTSVSIAARARRRVSIAGATSSFIFNSNLTPGDVGRQGQPEVGPPDCDVVPVSRTSGAKRRELPGGQQRVAHLAPELLPQLAQLLRRLSAFLSSVLPGRGSQRYIVDPPLVRAHSDQP